MHSKPVSSIDEYIAGYPADVQAVLNRLRALVHETVPEVSEKISYKMPGFFVDGMGLVWFGAYKHHIGMYPRTEKMEAALGAELQPHIASKGSLHFPLNQALPYDLIRRIIEQRLKEVRS